MAFSDIAHRKVAGVPVIYLAGGAVAILAVVAWKLKPTPAVTDTSTPVDSGGDPNSVDESAYAGLATQGTVTVVQQPNQTTPDAVVPTNGTWVRDGATWLVNQQKATGTVAYNALSKYVAGQDRSFDEQALVDAVIAHQGFPPDDIAEGGTTGSKPAQKQGEPPTVHTITGASDDSWAEIAQLYYGSGSADNQDLLQFANPSIGASQGPFAVGTKINVPAFHAPKTYRVPKGPVTWASVAAKNGISEVQLRNLNNGAAAWRNAATLATGQVVRVG
jgi:hypothetical protein